MADARRNSGIKRQPDGRLAKQQSIRRSGRLLSLKSSPPLKRAKFAKGTTATERPGTSKSSKEKRTKASESASDSAGSSSPDIKLSSGDDSAIGSDAESPYNVKQRSTSKRREPLKTAATSQGMSTDADALPSIVQYTGDVDQSWNKGPIQKPLKKIVKQFEKLKDAGDDSLTKVQLCGQNFVIAIIGPKGGKISLPDGSVEIDVPPGALSKEQIIYCCRPANVNEGDRLPRQNGRILYSVPLKLKAEDKKFKKKVLLKFRHFCDEFENESQKKKLAAFVQPTQDSKYQIDTEAEIEIGKEWVKLKVENFCNRAIGADERVNIPPPALKFLATSFLTFREFSRKTAVQLFLLIGPDDHSHMQVLRNNFGRQLSDMFFGQSGTVRHSPNFERFSRQAASGLRFDFRNGHYIAQHQNKVFTSEEANCNTNYPLIFENSLKREGEHGFDFEKSLCFVKIAEDPTEDTNGQPTGRGADFEIAWKGHSDFVQPEEIMFDVQRRAIEGVVPPVPVSDGIASLAIDFGLQIRGIQPTEQD